MKKAQLDFCKIILRLNKNTPKNILLSETGLLPIHVLVKSRIVNYWAGLINGKTTKYAHCIVNYFNEQYSKGIYKSKWLDFIYKIIHENGMSNIIINPSQFNYKEFKQRVEDQYHQTCNEELENSNKSLFYKSIKDSFGYNELLDEIDTHLAICILKYQTSNHRLPIETGRWQQIPFPERYCPYCDRELGDEFHYLFICPKFSKERERFLKPYFYRHPSMFKTQKLFQSQNLNTIRKLGQMIKNILLVFK